MARDGGEILADDLPSLPLHFGIEVATVRKGVRALGDLHGQTVVGASLSRNARL